MIEQESPKLPILTKDGVTILKNISLSNRAENLGSIIVKKTASHTNQYAGDGTTTTALLATQIFKFESKGKD